MSDTPTSESGQPPVAQGNTPASGVSVPQTLLVLIMELIFVLFPFIVYIFVLIYQKRFYTFFSLSEWAFAGTLLFGQAMVKFLLGLMSGHPPKSPIKPVFVTVLILMFGFVPSLLALIFVLLNSEGGNKVAAVSETPMLFPNGWIKMQIIMFALAVAVYLYFGGVGEYLRQVNENKQK